MSGVGDQNNGGEGINSSGGGDGSDRRSSTTHDNSNSCVRCRNIEHAERVKKTTD